MLYLPHFHIINVIPQSGTLPPVYCLWMTCGDKCMVAVQVVFLETVSSIISDLCCCVICSPYSACLPQSPKLCMATDITLCLMPKRNMSVRNMEDGKGLHHVFVLSGVCLKIWSYSRPAAVSGTLLSSAPGPMQTARLVALLRQEMEMS